MEARPLCICLGVACLVMIHQSFMEASFSGGLHGTLSQDNVSCRPASRRGKPEAGAASSPALGHIGDIVGDVKLLL